MNLEARKPGVGLGNFELSERVIAAAIRVHRELGPGFLEIMYEEALAIELAAADIAFERQKLLLNFASTKLVVKRVGREYRPEPAAEISF